MITDLKEKERICREMKGSITILMKEDFVLDFRDSGKDYYIKLFNGETYDVEVGKFDQWENGDLAVSFFIVSNQGKLESNLPSHMKPTDVQIKVFTYRFDIIN